MALPQRLLFGAAYYPDYQRESKLDDDMKLMADAHFNVIRVGEGSWSHWEPEDGVFNLDWLEPTLDAAEKHGIAAVIGVPTFAIPQWLVRKHPEIALHDSTGHAMPFGWREEHNYDHPAYRYYEERMIRQIVTRYANHPAVVGWQLHNEPGFRIDYSPTTFEGFKDWLRQRYGTVEALNTAWGSVYWSHEISDWDDLWKPEGNCQPSYDIEWRRYQAELTDRMLERQRTIITELCRDDQFITVNIALGRDTLDEALSAKQLDIAGSDIYYQPNNALRLPDPQPQNLDWMPAGPWQIALLSDRSYAIKQQPFFVPETNGGAVGGSADKYPSFPGQIRQGAWQMIARGARKIEYWQWRQIPFGTEMYWGGVLPHDGRPGRIYREIAEIGREIEANQNVLTGLQPDADIAMLYSVHSRWALSYEPPFANDMTEAPHRTRNPKAYDDMFTSFYQGVFLAGHQARIVFDSQLTENTPVDDATQQELNPESFASEYPVLIAVGAYICDDNLRDWLRRYALAGGHLVLGPRTAYADELAQARQYAQPSGLSDLAHTDYQEFAGLQRDLPVHGINGFHTREGSAATRWFDCLQPNGSDVLASNDDLFYSHFPVITTSTAGEGRITIVGTLPNAPLAASIIEYAAPASPWYFEGTTVTHSSASNASGEKLHWLFNWSWEPAHVQLPVSCVQLDAGSGSNTASANESTVDTVTLGPWDVAMLREV